MNLSTFTLAAIVALCATTETIATARIGRNLVDATKCVEQNIAIALAGKTKDFSTTECSVLGGIKKIYGQKKCDDSAFNSEEKLCLGKSCPVYEYTGASAAGCEYFYENGAFTYGVGASITAVVGATLVLLS
mmetsp:Transcript_5287/g.6173  ORF Transcript_5287/g.6173 Transcript_5287/m.6173 type:complete len:132 (+) Transcript_5287:120-515(+)